MITHPDHHQVHGPPNELPGSTHSAWAVCVHSVYPWMAWIPSAPIRQASGSWALNQSPVSGGFLSASSLCCHWALPFWRAMHPLCPRSLETSWWPPDHRPVWIRRRTDWSWFCIPKQGRVGTGCRFALSHVLDSFIHSSSVGTSFQILSILLRLGPRECLSFPVLTRMLTSRRHFR